MARDKKRGGELALIRDVEPRSPAGLRADIKSMVHQARQSFHADIVKVLTETSAHAAEVEKAIGDISQTEALQGVKDFFNTELDRQLMKYDGGA